MSGVSAYILSIAGIVLISIILDFAMPGGSMGKYIKSIIGFFIIAVIISPLPNLLSINNVSSFFDVSGYDLQEDYLYKLNKSKVDVSVSEIKITLNTEGYKNVEIEVSLEEKVVSQLKVKEVFVNLSKLVILDKAEHKNINEIKARIGEIVSEKLNVKKEQIKYET